LDGYFLALNTSNSTMYISNLLDGTTWITGSQFAQRSIAPDPWKSMKVLGRYIWLFGEQTSEVWYDTGSGSFPFAPYPSGLIPYGIAAPFSAAIIDGSLIWLGASRTGNVFVLRAAGFAAEVVSDYPRENTFRGYATISDAVADTYNDLGHSFYLLTFPTQNITWAWDVKVNSWSERGTWISEQNIFSSWRPRWHAMAFGQHRMLDSSGGSVYQMSSTIGTDIGGRPVRRLRSAPGLLVDAHDFYHLSPMPSQRIYYGAFELALEPGLGTVVDPGTNPQVMMRMSNDGGKTWGTEMMRGAGQVGQYKKRVRWDRLGTARHRVFEVSVTDPIPWRIMSAYLTLGQPIRAIPRFQDLSQVGKQQQ
jgi:hypothetical protein